MAARVYFVQTLLISQLPPEQTGNLLRNQSSFAEYSEQDTHVQCRSPNPKT